MFDHRRVPLVYSFLFFDLGPGFSVPLSFRAFSISSSVQSRKALRPIFNSFGGFSFPSANHRSNVALWTPIDLATSDVESGLIVRLKSRMIKERVSSDLFGGRMELRFEQFSVQALVSVLRIVLAGNPGF